MAGSWLVAETELIPRAVLAACCRCQAVWL